MKTKPERQNPLRNGEDDLLRAQAETLCALLKDEPNPDTGNEDMEEFPALAQSRIEHVKLAQQFIDEISATTFDNGNLDANVIECLRNPEEGPVDISDPDIRLSLDLFMACEYSSQQTSTSPCPTDSCRNEPIPLESAGMAPEWTKIDILALRV